MRSLATGLALAFLALPSTATAGTAEVVDGKLAVRAAAGQTLRLIPRSDGAYLVRRYRFSPGRLGAGPGCTAAGERELRCTGQIHSIDVQLDGSGFTTEQLLVPLAVTGGAGRDNVTIGSSFQSGYGSKAPVSIDTRGGNDYVSLRGVAGVPYVVDGGDGDDRLDGNTLPDPSRPSFTLRGGPGRDVLTGSTGADELDGGPGPDDLRGGGGGDTLLGGEGTDTALFSPRVDNPGHPVTVTLDGERNDGAAGENALVGADVENASIDDAFMEGPVAGGNTLVGNDGPNVLTGAGTVRGLGGDDVISSGAASPNELDGGDGNDRISARVTDEFTSYRVADKIACGAGDDVLFTDRRDPRPADCEHFNLGVHVDAASAHVGPAGWAYVRLECVDLVPCEVRWVTLFYKKRVANDYSGRGLVRLAPGQSVVRRVRLNRRLRRPGRFAKLKVTAVPSATAGGLIAGFGRPITLIRGR